MEQADGHLLLEVPVRGNREVLQSVLCFGALAEVVAPEPLREAFRSELAAMTDLYG